MVPVDSANLLAAACDELKKFILDAVHDAPAHSQGFALRVGQPVGLDLAKSVLDVAALTGGYGGYPEAAALGFHLGHEVSQGVAADRNKFTHALNRIRERADSGIRELEGDDVGLLGLVDGVAALRLAGDDADVAAQWLRERLDTGGTLAGMRRLRLVAKRLLNGPTGSWPPPDDDVDAIAVELCCRRAWPSLTNIQGAPSEASVRTAFTSILTSTNDCRGDVERSVMWYGALNSLANSAATEVIPDVDDVVRILRATQGGLRRWVCENRPQRHACKRVEWLIDREAHVQAYLWSVLYPIFTNRLLDEQYLAGFGGLQPRYDFAISDLCMIIEVKFVRQASDFKTIEEEVAADEMLYFTPKTGYEKMIVYVYDDSDPPRPEHYAVFENAIKKRSKRIQDVVIVRRPGALPDRSSRSE